MTSKEILIVETVRGELEASKLSNDGICLFHERLTPNVYAVSCDRPISLQHLDYHRNNLLSLENTALTPGMIDHQLQVLLQRINRTSSDVIVLDGSSYEAKVPELLEKYVIVKGYQYRLTGNPSQGQKNVLLSKEHISKQLEYEFKLGNGKFKPGFIGELLLNDCLQNSNYFNAYKAYLQFSARTNCFITVNSLQFGQKAVFHHLRTSNKPHQSENFNRLLEVYKKIQAILQTAKDANAKKLVIYNIPFVFQTVINEDRTQTTANLVQHLIVQLLSKYQCYFGFDLSRYSQSKQSLYYIGQLIAYAPNAIILSGGLAYKVDLTTNGGTGYLYYKGEKLSEMCSIATENGIRNALFTNKMSLLAWKVKIQETKIVILWKCSQCGNEQPENVQSFRKFGKQFCSIKCLKGHQF